MRINANTEKIDKLSTIEMVILFNNEDKKVAVIDASECPPTFGIDDNVIIGVISGRIEAVAGWKEEEALKAFEKAGGNARAAILSLVNDSSKIEGD